MKYLAVVLAALTMLFCGTSIVVASGNTGDVFTVVTSEELKTKIDRKEQGLVIVDTRSQQEYDDAHIKDAVNIPWATLEADRSVLNFPWESTILFYCNGLA